MEDPELQALRDQIFEDSFDVPASALEAFLDTRCAPHTPTLRAELERLLAVNRRLQKQPTGSGFLDQTASTWAVPRLEPGERLGRYEIDGVIASGGMSVVYRARDIGIGRLVAIKVLTPPAGLVSGSDSRFHAEVRILGSIRHPNIVQIFDFGELHGVPYLVMEYLSGEDLAAAIAADRCGDFARKLDVAKQVAAALQHVHQSGIIHRDIKPANIFIEPDGAVKLMDFGISRLSAANSGQTTGLIGTPEYLPPEHIKGQAPTTRFDIYSFGVVLLELFSGCKAYSGNTAEVLYRVVHEDIPYNTLRATTPPALLSLIRATTQKDPAKRPESFTEVVAILESIPPLSTLASVSKRRELVLIATVAVVLLCAVGTVGILATLRAKSRAAVPATTVTVAQQIQRQQPAANPNEKPAVGQQPAPQQQDRQQNEPPTRDVATPRRFSPPRIYPADPQPATTAPEVKPPPVLPATDNAKPTPLLAIASPPLAAAPATPSTTTTTELDDARGRHAKQQQQEIYAILQRYAAAYNAKDLAQVVAVRPSLSEADRRNLMAAFSAAKAITLQLTPLAEPEFTGDLMATVRCRRLVEMTPHTGKAPKPQLDTCLFRLERKALGPGGWFIVGQQ
jgi:serine/threonine protein kinase